MILSNGQSGSRRPYGSIGREWLARGLAFLSLAAALPLKAQTPPEILTHPRSTTVVIGSILRLNVTAIGALQCQWLKDGADLIGGTNWTLTVTNCRLADRGVYIARVSNGFGFTNSDCAMVSVVNHIAWADAFPVDPRANGWVTSQYLDLGGFSWNAVNRTFTISNSAANDSSLHRALTGLLPSHNYRLHAWVKGGGIAGGGTGANICQWNQNIFNKTAVNAGSFDWTNLSLVVATDTNGAVEFGCRLGHFGSTVTGTATFANVALEEVITLTNPTHPTVRVAYVIPSNRVPQTNGVSNLQKTLVRWQAWYRDQMERYGFGPKTFVCETEADGVAPRVHVVYVEETDATLRGTGGLDQYGRVTAAAQNAGVPVGATKQVWLLIPETHLMQPDGSILGGVFLGGGGGSGDAGGTAVVDGTALTRLDPVLLTNNLAYDGLIWREIGPYPMKYATTFPWFEGQTIGSVSSSAHGGALHELSHGLGLIHDYRNEGNTSGNVMWNGCRRIRGNFHPTEYPDDYTRLSYAAALVLNTSRYFNSTNIFTDDTKPDLTITTVSPQSATNGLLQINFIASDNAGLASALLHFGSGVNIVGEQPLSGMVANATFMTPYFTSGETNAYGVSVLDTSGNRTFASFQVAVTATTNQAPQLVLRILPTSACLNEPVSFDASLTSVPNGSAGLLLQWDFDGDGIYDTALATNRVTMSSFSHTGVRLVRARAVDVLGAESVSTWLAVRVYEPRLAFRVSEGNTEVSWPIWMAGFDLQFTDSLAAAGSWQPTDAPCLPGMTNIFTESANGIPHRFYRLKRQ